MYFLRANPFLRLFPPFALGIAAAEYLPAALQPAHWAVAIVSAGCLLIVAGLPLKYPRRWLFGSLLVGLLVFSGWLRSRCDDELRLPRHFCHLSEPGPYWTGVVTDAPIPGKRLKTPVRLLVNYADSTGTATPVDGNALLFIARSDAVDSLRYGDTLLFRAGIIAAQPPRNPHAFDYARYLHHKDFHYVAYVKSDSVLLLGRNGGLALWRAAFTQRSRLLALLERYFPDAASQAVASALLVGYKEELPDDLEQAYINTGSMHALAVSGSHVGFVYAGLFLLFRRLKLRGPAQRWFETLGLLAGVWAFTLITGATASVLRASWMFSLFIIGKAIFRAGNVWNTLAASAFVLLWADPDYLFDAGFQLSYAAVAGMVFFYPLMYKRLPVMPRWADVPMQVLLVGVAAQLGTLPMSLFYFHQFPVYFWLAGWVVVLGGAVFLWGGALLVLLDAVWPGMAALTGKFLFGVVWLMNTSVMAIQRLPGSVIDGIWFPAWAAWMLYGVLALAGAAVVRSKAKYITAALGLMALLCVFRLIREEKRLQQRELVIYNCGGANLMDVVVGRERYTWSDSVSLKQETFAAQAHRWALGLRRKTALQLDSTYAHQGFAWAPPLLQFSGRHLLIVGEGLTLPPDGLVQSPICWIIGEPDETPGEWLTRVKPEALILGATLRRKTAAQWEAAAAQFNVACHQVRRDGAWVYRQN